MNLTDREKMFLKIWQSVCRLTKVENCPLGKCSECQKVLLEILKKGDK